MVEAVSVVIPTRDRSHIVVDTVRLDTPSAGRRAGGHRRRRRLARWHGGGARGARRPAGHCVAQRVQPRRGRCAQPRHRASGASVGRVPRRRRPLEPGQAPRAARSRPGGGCRLRLHRRAGGRSRRRPRAVHVPGVHARGAATRHSQPQPGLRGLVQRARADRPRAASRWLRRVASPYCGLGYVDPPDRGRATGRVPRTSGGVRRARDEHASDRDRQRDREGPYCAPSTRTAACRAGSIPSSSADGSPRDRPTRGDPGAPRSRMPARPCVTEAGPMLRRAVGQRCTPSASAARQAPSDFDGSAPDWLSISP